MHASDTPPTAHDPAAGARPRWLSPSTRRTVAVATAVAMLAVACSRVPYTQRRQFNLIPDNVLADLGRTSYQTALDGAPIVRSGSDVQVLERVGRNIARVAGRDGAPQWQFTLLQSDQANAWALPGGYIAFYDGILPALRNEAGMAFVMGHEVGHAVAQHSGERLSQQVALLGGMQVLDMYLTQRSSLSAQQRQLILAALGLGAEVGLLLPYSRLHEREADVIGLMYMAEAGYPPRESISVWDRMSEMAGARPPAFLSTHPSPEDRQVTLREWMPRAQRKYQRNKLQRDTTATLWPAKGRDRVSDAETDRAPDDSPEVAESSD